MERDNSVHFSYFHVYFVPLRLTSNTDTDLTTEFEKC